MIMYDGKSYMDVADVARMAHCSHSSAKQCMYRFGEVLDKIRCDHCNRTLTSIYVEEDSFKEWFKAHPKLVGSYRKKVLCVETGEVFPCVVDAARTVGKSVSGLYNVLSTKSSKQTFDGKHWRYVDAVNKSGGEEGV